MRYRHPNVNWCFNLLNVAFHPKQDFCGISTVIYLTPLIHPYAYMRQHGPLATYMCCCVILGHPQNCDQVFTDSSQSTTDKCRGQVGWAPDDVITVQPITVLHDWEPLLLASGVIAHSNWWQQKVKHWRQGGHTAAGMTCIPRYAQNC